MKWLTPLLFGLCQLVAYAYGTSAYGSSVLVVLDALSEQDRFSQFWASLQERGFHLTFREADSGPALMSEGEAAYDHVVLFAPKSQQLSTDLSAKSLFSFITDASAHAPHNILAALSPDATDSWRNFAREFSVEFDAADTLLQDHHNFVPSLDDDGSHSVVALKPSSGAPSQVVGSKAITPDAAAHGGPVLYRGIAHTVPDLFPLATTVLAGAPTSYSSDPSTTFEVELDGTHGPALAGQDAKLVTAFQTLTGSRTMWTGSLDMFSDDFFQVSPAGGQKVANEALAKDLTAWTFQEEGVLRVDAVRHHAVGEHAQKEQYRIRQELVYEIELSQFINGGWRPVTLEGVQLEVSMLDPFWRVALQPSTDCSVMTTTSTCYATTVKLPDRHGVFTLSTEYKRSGWTPVEHKQTIAITPLRHDEHTRFIPGAWPSYLAAFATSGTFLAFVVLWLSLDSKASDKVQQSRKKAE